MKKLLILLILSITSAVAMDADDEASSHNDSASSSSRIQHAQHAEHDDFETDTDEEDDELARLAANTEDLHANPHAITRGFLFGKKKKHRKKKPKAPSSNHSSDDEKHYDHVYASTSFGGATSSGFETREATYDDVVRMIQSNSRMALSEARNLNREYLAALLKQIQEGVGVVQEGLAGDAERVVTVMTDLQTRLGHVEQLLPKVARLLQNDAILAEQFEHTCQELIRAFQSYAEEAEERDDTHKRTLGLINTRLKSMGQTLGTISRDTGTIATTTRDIRGDVHTNRLKDMFARYTISSVAGGTIALLIMWLLGSDYTRDMEMNESLHEEA